MRKILLIIVSLLFVTTNFVTNKGYADVSPKITTVPDNVKPIYVSIRALTYKGSYVGEIVSPIDLKEGLFRKLLKIIGIYDRRNLVIIRHSLKTHEYMEKLGCPWFSGGQLAHAFVRPAKEYIGGRLSVKTPEYPLYYVDSMRLVDEKHCYEADRGVLTIRPIPSFSD